MKIDKNLSLDQIRRAPKQLLLGVSIMLISSFAGAAILSTQNQTESLLVLTHDVVAGQKVSKDDFIEQEVLISSLNTQWLHPDAISESMYFVTSLQADDTLRASDVGTISTNQRLIHLSLDLQVLPLGLKVGNELEVWSVNPMPRLIGTFVVANLQLAENRGMAQISLISPASEVDDILTVVSIGEYRLVTVI